MLTLAADRSFDSGAVVLNSSTYTQVGVLDVTEFHGRVIIQLTVGGGHALTSLKVTRGATIGAHAAGLQKDLAVDADLDTATNEIPNVLPASAYTAADGTQIQIVVNCEAATEIGIYAKSAAGTLQMRGYVGMN